MFKTLRMVTVAIVTLLMLAPPALAQTTLIKGKVVDSEGKPVQGAQVSIEFKGGVARKYQTKTDRRGEFVAHLDVTAASRRAMTNPVDGDAVPVPHFGVLLTPDDWQRLADRLRGAGVEFVIEPHTRFAGEVGEQSTMFLLDPSGNALEFKAFADDAAVFAK